jgi:CheY-like chemotaxis protein
MKLKPILYAEDEDNDAFFLKRAFSKTGIAHPLVVMPDGQQAIDYLAGTGGYTDRNQHPLPCLLLLDLNMPMKSGLEVLEWIRKSSPVATLPVIILSSSLHDADIHRSYRQGANAYLVKPVEPAQLLAMTMTIRDFWLTQNRTAREMRDDGG